MSLFEIPAWPPQIPEVEEAIRCCLADGSWGQYHGRPIEQLQQAVADWLGVPYVWPCSSGTIAVELALRGLSVTSKDHVLLAGYDFPGNFRAIQAIGARPILVDVAPDRYTLSVDSFAEAIQATDTPIKAAIVSHLHGDLADIDRLIEICRRNNILVLEDACQVPGAIVAGKLAGSRGDASVFSFGGSKLLTAGRGGAVVTSDKQVLQRVRIAAERGNDAFPLSSLQAACLVPQIEKLPTFHSTRLASAKQLIAGLQDCTQFKTLSPPASGNWDDQQPAFYKFPLRLVSRHDRESVINLLKRQSIPADIGFRGFHLRSQRRCDRVGTMENSRLAAEQTILIHHPILLSSPKQVELLTNKICELDQRLANDNS